MIEAGSHSSSSHVPPAVLVTGGAGYIGSHTAKRLFQAGYLPVTYDDLSTGRREFVQWGPLEVGSLGDRPRLEEVLRKYEPVAVLHFAARSCVGESVFDPARYYNDNVAGSLNLLEAMRACGVRHLVFSSTCAVYGSPATVPITEETPPQPTHPYGRSKWMVEQMLEDYRQAYGLRFAVLRYFNAAGADSDGDLGEQHPVETRLIPLALDAAAGKRDQLRVFGGDYATPDGTCVRDYIHVEDLAQRHCRALEHLLAGRDSVTLNLGTGVGYSVLEVVTAVEHVTGLCVPMEWAPRRPGDPAVLVANADRARAVLDWRPEFFSLWDMIASAWAWRRHDR